jgi:hypothetical protein
MAPVKWVASLGFTAQLKTYQVPQQQQGLNPGFLSNTVLSWAGESGEGSALLDSFAWGQSKSEP